MSTKNQHLFIQEFYLDNDIYSFFVCILIFCSTLLNLIWFILPLLDHFTLSQSGSTTWERFLATSSLELFYNWLDNIVVCNLVKYLLLLLFVLGTTCIMYSNPSRSKQRTDQRVLVLTLKLLALKKLVFPL